MVASMLYNITFVRCSKKKYVTEAQIKIANSLIFLDFFMLLLFVTWVLQ